MTLDLEKHLADLCNVESPRLDLYERLLRIKNRAEFIWREQRLKWFTDHRAITHSRYIIEHLGSVLEHLQSTQYKLNPHELFVLLAACYLHDIGMQYFDVDDGRGVDQFTDNDYTQIRNDHPSKTKELILERVLLKRRDDFDIGLDADTQYLVPIALVCQGHGTAFYRETISELQSLPHRPGNLPFRGDLLAALLLMGDELDLHERRATFSKEFALSSVSLLHNYIHHYVTSVEIVDGKTSKQRHIRLMLEYPKDSDDFRLFVRNHIISKLSRQIELTSPILEASTNGELTWDREFELIESVDNYGIRRSFLSSAKGQAALNQLQLGLLSDLTVDRHEITKGVTEAINKSKYQFQAIQVIDQERSDWAHIVKWLSAKCCHEGISLLQIGFRQSIGRNVNDVNYQLLSHYCCLGKSESIANNDTRYSSDDGSLIQLIKDSCNNNHHVLLLERIDKAEHKTEKWIRNWLLPEIAKSGSSMLIVFSLSSNCSKKYEKLSFVSNTYYLAPFSKDDIDWHLHNKLGFSVETASKESEFMFSLSSGCPLSVHVGLKSKFNEKVIITQ